MEHELHFFWLIEAVNSSWVDDVDGHFFFQLCPVEITSWVKFWAFVFFLFALRSFFFWFFDNRWLFGAHLGVAFRGNEDFEIVLGQTAGEAVFDFMQSVWRVGEVALYKYIHGSCLLFYLRLRIS